MQLRLLSLAAVCCLSMSGISHAESAVTEKLNVDLSYLINDSRAADGSKTNKQNLAGNAKYQRRQGVWGQELQAEAVNSQGSSDNLERYLAAAKATHYSTDTFYQYGRIQLEKDLNSAFDYQGNVTVGLGYEVLRDDVQFLTTEAGIGVRHSKQKLAPRDTTNELLGTVGIAYERKITDTLKFNQDLAYEYGEDTRILRSRSAFSAALSQNISGIVSYQLKDTMSDDGDSRDGLTSIGLKYSR
jgi:putative salt-induced outer membrane protein